MSLLSRLIREQQIALMCWEEAHLGNSVREGVNMSLINIWLIIVIFLVTNGQSQNQNSQESG